MECIYSIPCNPCNPFLLYQEGDEADRGAGVTFTRWDVGHRVEALWRGRRVVRQETPSGVLVAGGDGQGQQRREFEETVCDYFLGKIVAVNADGTFGVQFDNGDVRLDVPACELRNLGGLVGVVVKRLFRPQDSELREFTERRLLLGCKGMYVCIFVCMQICMYVYMYVCVYVCMQICMYVCVKVCMYVYM